MWTSDSTHLGPAANAPPHGLPVESPLPISRPLAARSEEKWSPGASGGKVGLRADVSPRSTVRSEPRRAQWMASVSCQRAIATRPASGRPGRLDFCRAANGLHRVAPHGISTQDDLTPHREVAPVGRADSTIAAVGGIWASESTIARWGHLLVESAARGPVTSGGRHAIDWREVGPLEPPPASRQQGG